MKKRGVLVDWEEHALLSSAQQDAVSRMRVLWATVPQARKGATPHTPKHAVPAPHPHLLEHFLHEHAGGEGGVGVEGVLKPGHRDYYAELRGYHEGLTHMVGGLNAIDNKLTQLGQHYENVSSKTTEVREECESMLQHKNELLEEAESLEHHLHYFEEASAISDTIHRLARDTLTVNQDGMSVAAGIGAEYKDIIERLDVALAYMRTNSDFKDAKKYGALFVRLRAKVIRSIKAYFTQVLRTATRNLKSNTEAENKPAEGNHGQSSMQSVKAFVELRALAAGLSALVGDIQERAQHNSQFKDLLKACHEAYFAQRHALVYNDIVQYLTFLSQKSPLCALVRTSSNFLIELCNLEHQLFLSFFGTSEQSAHVLDNLLQQLSSALYMVIRPEIIKQTELDVLCEVVSILKEEVLETQIAVRGEAIEPFAVATQRLLQDVQERLAYRAQAHLREDIATIKPQERDYDYPALLVAVPEPAAEGEGKAEEAAVAAPASPRSPVRAWFPTLEKTLVCLSQLYRCLEVPVFRYLAQEALELCTRSLNDAKTKVAARHSGDPTSCDATLFIIQHLLILREQLSPFQMDFAITEKTLDFRRSSNDEKPMTPVLHRGEEGWWSAVKERTPRVMDHKVDSKKDMERELVAACKDLVSHYTKQLVGPLLAYLQRVSGLPEGRTAPLGGAGGEEATHAAERRQELEKLLQNLCCVNDSEEEKEETCALVQRVSCLQSHLSLYINNPTTEKILFRPVLRTLGEVMSQLKLYTEHHYPDALSGDSKIHARARMLDSAVRAL